MAQTIRDKVTGARFRIRTSPEQRERDAVHHSPHYEELMKALIRVLTPEQKLQLREYLKECPHKCIQRAVESASPAE